MVLLFEGEIYYPLGGAKDMSGIYQTVDDAKAAFDPNGKYRGGWANILDLDTLKIVASCEYGEWEKIDANASS